MNTYPFGVKPILQENAYYRGSSDALTWSLSIWLPIAWLQFMAWLATLVYFVYDSDSLQNIMLVFTVVVTYRTYRQHRKLRAAFAIEMGCRALCMESYGRECFAALAHCSGVTARIRRDHSTSEASYLWWDAMADIIGKEPNFVEATPAPDTPEELIH